MLGRTSRFGGTISIDRDRYGGLETGDGESSFGFTLLGVGEDTGEPPLTWGLAGLIGVYRTVNAASAFSEATGASAFGFAAAGVSTGLEELTGSFAGLIASWREVNITPTTGYTLNLSAVVNGTMDPLTARTLELTASAIPTATVVIRNDIGAVGTSAFPFAVVGRPGFVGDCSFPFRVFGGGTAVQNPLSLAVGRGNFPFVVAAVGEPTWPTRGTSVFPFAAAAVFEGEQHAEGASVFTFTAQGVSPGLSLAEGTSYFPFAASARAVYLYMGAIADVDRIIPTVRGYGTITTTIRPYGTIEASFE